MRLAHLSDTHLGYRRFLKTNSEGFNQREDDVLVSFECALEAIAKRDPDLVIHAGDLFHQVRPSNATIVRTYAILSRHQADRKGKPFIIIGGNHDTPRSVDVGNILSLYRGIPGVHLVTDGASFVDLPELDAEVLCVPHQALRLAPKTVYKPTGKRKFKFLTLHGLLVDAMRVKHGGEDALTQEQLQGKSWDYVALGDFHNFTTYADNVAYAGSTDFTSSDIWSEVGEGCPKKGWVWFDTDSPKAELVPIPQVRRVIDLPVVDASDMGSSELLAALHLNFTWDPKQSPIVRQVVQNCTSETRSGLRMNQLRELQQACLNYLIDARITSLTSPNKTSSAGSLESDWTSHVRQATLPAGVSSDELVKLGLEILQEVRGDAAVAS